MYVSNGYPSGSIPNNSAVRASYSGSYNIDIRCITNSSTVIHGSYYTRAQRYSDIYFQGSYSAGVARMYTRDRYPYEGVYTAHVTDVNGTSLKLNVGLYNYRFSSKFSVLDCFLVGIWTMRRVHFISY